MPITIPGGREPRAGICVTIDGDSWHTNGQHCSYCGFGIDEAADGLGFWNEPIVVKEDEDEGG